MTFIKAVLTSTILILASFGAFAQNNNYLNAQLAIADIDGFDDGLAVVATYGMPMPNVHKNFAIEAELSITISDAETTLVGVPLNASYVSAGGYAVYNHPINPDFSLFGRAGLVYIDFDIAVGGPGVTITDVDEGLKLSYGIGLTYNINKTMNLTAGYTALGEDASQLSAGLQYKF